VTERLHARTVALAYGPDPLQFDGSPTVLFDRPGLTLVGWGTASLVRADEADPVLAAIPAEDPVRHLGSGPVAVGALPFSDTERGLLVIPRFTMGIARDEDGVPQRWVTAVGPADAPLPEPDEFLESVLWQYDTGLDAPDDPAVAGVSTAMDSAGYAGIVAEAVAAMRAPGATLRKVVLGRPLAVDLTGPLHLASVLRRLRAAEPNCTVFSMPVPDGVFFGASPELLVSRHGRSVTCYPLAGTVPRGDTARRDADAQRDLAGSAKSREEHRLVVDAIAAQLEPFTSALAIPDAPSLVAFRSVAHLGTRIEGTLAGEDSVMTLLARLHPTPAVGGTPRAEALARIGASEAGDRGYWAGPVGWVGAGGDGEWMIGLRSAQLNATGDRLSLRAGAGIVAGSDPLAEAAETNVKLKTVLETVVPRTSVQLA
jgi:menaquinone-specific isochorismate synthase